MSNIFSSLLYPRNNKRAYPFEEAFSHGNKPKAKAKGRGKRKKFEFTISIRTRRDLHGNRVKGGDRGGSRAW